MSSEAATRAGAAPRPASARTLTDRFLAAVPLLSVFVWLAILYGWEAWDHQTPWLFTDELLLAQLGRSIAHHGHPMLRARHLPFAIGIAERDAWLGCMKQAMEECELEPELRKWLLQALAGTADWMRNR